jgi:hypothetical protein
MARSAIPKTVLRDLSIASKNKCAFPGCDHPILNPVGDYIAELCHIEAAEAGGPRFNPGQSDEDRVSRDNLLFLCHAHHKETDNESVYTVARLRKIKLDHESLPAVVFNSELLLREVEKVLAKQEELAQFLVKGGAVFHESENYAVRGPLVEDAWVPDAGRFYRFSFPNGSAFKFMMKDGWMHIEQTLVDGSVAYYEVNEKGNVRESKLPHPLAEYTVEIPLSMILRQEMIPSSVGDRAIKTSLKWSAGSVVQHYHGDTLVGLDCHARCVIKNVERRIEILAKPQSVDDA